MPPHQNVTQTFVELEPEPVLEVNFFLAVGCSIIVCVFTYLYVRSRAQVKTMKDINQIIKLSMEFRKIDPEDKKVVAKVMGATSSLVRRNSLAPNDSSGKQRKRDKLADKLGMSKLKSKFKTEVSELVKTHIHIHTHTMLTPPTNLNLPQNDFMDMDIMGLVSIPSSEVTIVKRGLGAGAYGEVHKAKYKDQPVAIKTIIQITEKSMNEFRHEVMLSVQLDHPNLILVLGAMWDEDMIAIVIEYAEGGSLDYAKKRSKNWNWTDPLFKIATGTCRGIAYLHSASYYNDVTRTFSDCILHRDIKPGNILLSEVSECENMNENEKSLLTPTPDLPSQTLRLWPFQGIRELHPNHGWHPALHEPGGHPRRPVRRRSGRLQFCHDTLGPQLGSKN